MTDNNSRDITTHDQRRLTIATVICTGAIVLMILYGFWFIQGDDSYIFYSYAKNLVEGNGYVFNVGERVNATTSPLYTLLLALLYLPLQVLPFITIPLLGHLIGAISLFFLCYFLMQSFRDERHSLFPYILPLVLLASPFLAPAVGMELFLSMMLGVLSLSLYASGKRIAASLACSFAVLARPDMLLLAILMVVYDFIRYRRWPSVSMWVVFLMPILVWIVFSLAYFGSAIPSTLSAKLIQTEIGLWGKGPVFFRGLLSGNTWDGGSVIGKLLAACLLLGLFVLIMNFKRWSLFRHPVFHLILLWNVIYLVVYGFILKAPAYEWYYTPLALSTSVLIALLVEGFYRIFSSSRAVRSWFVLPVIYLVLVLAGVMFPFVVSRQPISPIEQNYRRVAEWLNANAEMGSIVGTNCIG
ncbi:hypothetical protein KKB28_07645, partial [bacterium]|nr:hypothetical protein [bacterium]